MSDRILSFPHNISVTVRQPYAEGHPLTELEAEKLNHVLADSIRTSLHAKLKKLADGQPADWCPCESLQTEFQAFADSYAFSVKRERGQSADPITREAHKIAKDKIFMAIRNKGGNPTNYKAEEIATLVAKVMSSEKGEEIRAEAVRRIEASKKIASDTLDDIFADAAE